MQRWEILLGKWLGFTVMLSLYMLLMAGGRVRGGLPDAGFCASQNVGKALGLMWLNVPLMLGVSLLGGARLSTLANGVVAFGLYGLPLSGGGSSKWGHCWKTRLQ